MGNGDRKSSEFLKMAIALKLAATLLTIFEGSVHLMERVSPSRIKLRIAPEEEPNNWREVEVMTDLPLESLPSEATGDAHDWEVKVVKDGVETTHPRSSTPMDIGLVDGDTILIAGVCLSGPFDCPPELWVDESNVIMSERIGHGAFNEVWRGTIKRKDGTEETVAIAKLIYLRQQSARREITIKRVLKILSMCEHPAVVHMCGAVASRRSYYPLTVFPYYRNRSLGDYMSSDHGCMSFTQKYIVLYGCAQAMQYLHSMKIMHRYLTEQHVLLTDELYPKVAGFSLSKIVEDSMRASIYESRIDRTAPEMFLADEHYTFKVDVYAFGMMMFWLLVGAKPFDSTLSAFRLASKVIQGERPSVPESVPTLLGDLIRKCWAGDPESRPTFEEIVSQLEKEATLKALDVDMVQWDAYQSYLRREESTKQ